MEGPKTQEWFQCYGDVCFHLNMSCVQKLNTEMTTEDVTIAANTFTLLMPKHLCFLCQKGLLETTVDKLK